MPEHAMTYTIPANASETLATDAEQAHEYFVDQLGYSTFDVDVRATDDGCLDIAVGPGAAAPDTWPVAVTDAYCRRSKRERRRLDEQYGLPARIQEELEQALD